MKRFLKKSLVSVLIVMILFNFLLNISNVAYAGIGDAIGNAISTIGSGLVGILTWVPRVLLLGIVGGMHTLVSALAQIGTVESLEGDGTGTDFFVTPFHIFFNKIELIDVNFFNFDDTGDSPMGEFRLAVAGWYYTMRTIAAMVLAVILVYIGIRMAISTIASERAMYKKMLVDWITSLALLFFLHYIMVFVLMINDALVGAMEAMMKAVGMNDFISNLVDLSTGLVPDSVLLSFIAIGVYAIIVFQTLSFLLTYIKRMLNIGFLMIIAPLITITYSIDKIGDGKAQALNTWLKEFIYNILIQPFHCILFLAFAQIAYNLLSEDFSGSGSSLARAILAVLCVQYIKTGEELVKQIFGFKQAGSLATMAAGTAMAMTAMNQAGNVAKKAGSAAAGAKRAIGKNEAVKNLRGSISKAGSSAKSAISKQGEKLASKIGQSEKYKNMTKKHEENKQAREKKRETRKQEKASRLEAKDVEKATELANKKLQAKGVTRPANQDEISSALKEVKANRVAKATRNKNMRSAVGKGASFVGKGVASVGKVPLSLAKDTAKYIGKNSGKLVGAAVGGVIGFGALGAGDFMSAVTGYKIGTGFIEGYNSNTTKTLGKDARGYADIIARFSGDNNGESIASTTYSLGQGGAFSDMSKKLDEVVKKLNELGLNKNQARSLVGTVSKQVLKNPTNLDSDFIEDTINSEHEKGQLDGVTAENKQQIAQLLAGHAMLTAQSNLFKNLQDNEKAGRDLDTMGYVIGNFDHNTAEFEALSPDAIQVEKEVRIDPDTVTKAISSAFLATSAIMNMGDSSSVSQSDIQNTNRKIEELNSLLEQYSKASEFDKNQIVSAINNNNSVLQNFNQMAGSTGSISTKDFEAKMETYIRELKNVVPGQASTND